MAYTTIFIYRTCSGLFWLGLIFPPITSAFACKRGDSTAFISEIRPWYKYRKDGKAGREAILYFTNGKLQDKASVTVQCNGKSETTEILPANPLDSVAVLLPAGIGLLSTEITITLHSNDHDYKQTVSVPARKQWTVFIYPHSHVDIGYTALPADVERLHARNIDVGIDLAQKTQGYPEGSRFVWNPEATWVVANYLKQATPLQKQQFIEAVRKGWVQVDGGHSNMNTTTCSDEELLAFFSNSKEIEKTTGVPVTTMVQMDVPGAAWGIVPAAAQYGIKGMISFPNYFDVRKQWEHTPFYWLGPDGKSKILFLQGFPYGIGYTIKGSKYGLAKLQTYTDSYDRVSTKAPLEHFLDPFIFNETAKLEKTGCPYDLFAMTWSMADNCVIDADLPEAVKAWNAAYAYPRLVISGAKGILDAYERKYSSIIPTYQGDFTEFWTNGLGSDAASVGKGRIAKENLIQAEVLWSLLRPGEVPEKKFKQAWENNLLSAEHTWGAQDSKSLLAQQVEKIKASYFENAAQESEALINEAVAGYRDTTAPGFSVINTLSWQRDGIVTLTPAQSAVGDRVVDAHGMAVPSQRLSTGELIFMAQQVPALGSRFYKVVAGKVSAEADLAISATVLRNDFISVQLDPKTGNIRSVKTVADGYEYVDSTTGLNSYQYLTGVYNGRDYPKTPSTTDSVSISLKEKGPLLVSLIVKAKAEGVRCLTRETRLYKHAPFVELVNTFDKIPTFNKEGIHIGFGFHLVNPVNRMEMPWSIVMPNAGQLRGANKNWFAFQRWVDISNNDHGVTWSAIESPLIEWGKLSGNILDGARQPWLWQKEAPQSATLYSWPLNNHWDTNFPLEQGGMIKQRYVFTCHNRYDVVAANRFGLETHRPLIVVQAKKNIIGKPLFNISNPKLVVSALKRTAGNKAFLVRIKSVSDKTEQLYFTWPAARPKRIEACSIDEAPGWEIKSTIQIEPYGMTDIRLVF